MADVAAAWRTTMWAALQSQAAWRMRGQGELEGSERQPSSNGPSAFKEAAISECSSSENRVPSIPLVKPQCLYRRREAEDYRDEPRTQWCFRAESSRTAPAHSIPRPTVTAGTQFGPFKHIICARKAVKHHRRRSLTHPVPWCCCVWHLSVHYWAFKRTFLSVWHLDL